MASELSDMATEPGLVHRVYECTRHTASARVALRIHDETWGFVDPRLAARLGRLSDVFHVRDDGLRFRPHLDSAASRSAALAEIVTELSGSEFVSAVRGELYPAVRRWGDAPQFAIERGAVGAFGTPSFGVHMNGYVRTSDGVALWVAQRSDAKPTFPGRLDHLVAGGQPLGLSLDANMRKECAEEAGIPDSLLGPLRHVHALRYRLEDEYGFHDDTTHVFDLELPADFRPTAADDEVAAFELWPLARVIETLRTTRRFKTNVALVMLDWLLRIGGLDEDPERHALEELVGPLRQSLQPGRRGR